MKISSEVIEARIRAGYRPPQENPLICKNCGAIRDRKEIARGWYAAYPSTTYCFADDYERNPPKLIEGIVCWQMTDWNLPNTIGFREVTPPHKIEIIPPEEMRELR